MWWQAPGKRWQTCDLIYQGFLRRKARSNLRKAAAHLLQAMAVKQHPAMEADRRQGVEENPRATVARAVAKETIKRVQVKPDSLENRLLDEEAISRNGSAGVHAKGALADNR